MEVGEPFGVLLKIHALTEIGNNYFNISSEACFVKEWGKIPMNWLGFFPYMCRALLLSRTGNWFCNPTLSLSLSLSLSLVRNICIKQSHKTARDVANDKRRRPTEVQINEKKKFQLNYLVVEVISRLAGGILWVRGLVLHRHYAQGTELTCNHFLVDSRLEILSSDHIIVSSRMKHKVSLYVTSKVLEIACSGNVIPENDIVLAESSSILGHEDWLCAASEICLPHLESMDLSRERGDWMVVTLKQFSRRISRTLLRKGDAPLRLMRYWDAIKRIATSRVLPGHNIPERGHVVEGEWEVVVLRLPPRDCGAPPQPSVHSSGRNDLLRRNKNAEPRPRYQTGHKPSVKPFVASEIISGELQLQTRRLHKPLCTRALVSCSLADDQVLPRTKQHEILPMFSCRFVIGSKLSMACPATTDPIPKKRNLVCPANFKHERQRNGAIRRQRAGMALTNQCLDVIGCSHVFGGGEVAEQLDCTPPTKANRAQSPAGPISDIRKWESCRTMPLIDGYIPYARKRRAVPWCGFLDSVKLCLHEAEGYRGSITFAGLRENKSCLINQERCVLITAGIFYRTTTYLRLPSFARNKTIGLHLPLVRQKMTSQSKPETNFPHVGQTDKKAPLSSLPRTRAAARQHTYCAYHQIQTWLGKDLEPEEWGWILQNETPQPPTTLYYQHQKNYSVRFSAITRKAMARVVDVEQALEQNIKDNEDDDNELEIQFGRPEEEDDDEQDEY
ncbi:hypothetical protein PR048_001589 [Dryococelus australis]|uniref:Uncharacterized protein n=1 Tax=Dryococelus australis TaxID=614101 RepID=A0ABQ9IHX9_9NEOP|nr:hypothetical protein PR048_001589 [Dryococelus australis]